MAIPARPVPVPGRPKNLYVREDKILPHLAALAIVLTGRGQTAGRKKHGTMHLTPAAQAGELIEQLRARGVTLTYDPATQALRADTEDGTAVTVGLGR
jgi:site-specific DNA recombinase